MTRDEIRNAIYESLDAVAPESSASSLAPDADLREELDLDSMDFLNFVTGLHKRLGVEIREADYAKLCTLSGAESFLSAQLQ